MKLNFANCIYNIKDELWRVIEGNDFVCVEKAATYAKATGSIGATHKEIRDNVEKFATVERAKQP